MSDRELLELAAKACGPHIWFGERLNQFMDREHGNRAWNPLRNDGDALRLAVKLGLRITHYPIYETPKHTVIVRLMKEHDTLVTSQAVERYGDDPGAATRRAIVGSAAEIGWEMP